LPCRCRRVPKVCRRFAEGLPKACRRLAEGSRNFVFASRRIPKICRVAPKGPEGLACGPEGPRRFGPLGPEGPRRCLEGSKGPKSQKLGLRWVSQFSSVLMEILAYWLPAQLSPFFTRACLAVPTLPTFSPWALPPRLPLPPFPSLILFLAYLFVLSPRALQGATSIRNALGPRPESPSLHF